LEGNISPVHDPSIIREGDTYYVFSTNQPGGGGQPDISYVNGQYLLYYACSTFGKNVSAVGLVTNTTLNPSSPNYKWQDKGLVIASKPSDDYNCIDPNHSVDRAGNHWLAFGSFWGGIKIVQLDPQTFKPPPGDLHLSSLARGKAMGRIPSKGRSSSNARAIIICLSRSISAVAAPTAITTRWSDARGTSPARMATATDTT
jgi:arabinan endo-1,5-alpha-L-arabinosidase